MVSARSAACSATWVGGRDEDASGETEREVATSSAAASRCSGSVTGLCALAFFVREGPDNDPDLPCSSVDHGVVSTRGRRWGGGEDKGRTLEHMAVSVVDARVSRLDACERA